MADILQKHEWKINHSDKGAILYDCRYCATKSKADVKGQFYDQH
jgi:hypothetical protein